MDSAPSAGQMLEMYRAMSLIRAIEEQLADDFHRGDLPGPVHLCVGQEAVAVGVCAHLSDADWIASTHRGHGHFIAKGGEPRSLVAEVYGRETGICRGRGGSMHVADFGRGIIGANGIVGGGIGLAAGAALAAQLDGNGAVSVAFFGDGGANQGVLSEALNIAALWKLPLVLVCENNGFSEFSPTATVTAGSIADRALPYGVAAEAFDGNDLLTVWRAAANALDRARRGDGPTLLEARTYRLRGHVEAEVSFLKSEYREASEVEEWRARDPVRRFAEHLRDSGAASAQELDHAVAEAAATARDAVEFARSSPWPDPETAHELMFA